MAFNATDPESLALMIELQLTEIQSLTKGKHKEGAEGPDGELAFQLYGLQLETLNQSLSDHRLCQSIARAVDQDRDAIAAHVYAEDQAARDRQNALALASRGSNAAAIPENISQTPSIAVPTEVPNSTILNFKQQPKAAVAESSSSVAIRAIAAPEEPERHCTSCGDPVQSSHSVHCPCSHDYCQGCIIELFNVATTDESFFPPRCCKQTIPIGLSQEFLPLTLVEEFHIKEVEYATPNRTYCNKPSCSAFIPPSSIAADIATCLECKSKTCTICKVESHEGGCPEDPATKELLRLACENGWQRCRSCHRMVELDIGCNHMTCLCKAQFCYVCGETWKRCRCPQWDEDRLVTRANVVADRDGPHRNEAERRRAVARERRNLVENHICDHGAWNKRSGQFRCEECRDLLPSYIYECRQCRILACHRCRFNRL